MKLFTKFSFSIVSVTLFVVTVSLALNIYLIHDVQQQSVLSLLEDQSTTTYSLINSAASTRDVNENMLRFSSLRQSCIVLFDMVHPSNSVRYYGSAALGESFDASEERYMVAVENGSPYEQILSGGVDGNVMQLHGAPMPDGRYLLMASNTPSLASVIYEQSTSLSYIVILSIGMTFLLSYTLAKTITKPIESMGHAAADISKGNFDVNLDVKGKDELATLGIAMNTMAEQLKKSDDFKNQIITNVSHNLKTPIAAILTYCELLQSVDMPPEQQKSALGIIEARAHTLEEMVLSIIFLSKIQTGSEPVQLISCDLVSLCRRAMAEQQVLAQKRGLTLRLEAEDTAPVVTDIGKIGVVLLNLISNAIKHTPEGGEIVLSITETVDGYSVILQDSGEGIHPDDLPRIWDRFYKSPHSKLSRDDGSGIGMHIVGSIFELLSYPYNIESTLGEGTIVSFVIPHKDL